MTIISFLQSLFGYDGLRLVYVVYVGQIAVADLS